MGMGIPSSLIRTFFLVVSIARTLLQYYNKLAQKKEKQNFKSSTFPVPQQKISRSAPGSTKLWEATARYGAMHGLFFDHFYKQVLDIRCLHIIC